MLADIGRPRVEDFVDPFLQTIIGDIMDHDESVAPYFTDMGMHCLYCPASRGETLEEACEVHGVDPGEMIKKLNAHFAK